MFAYTEFYIRLIIFSAILGFAGFDTGPVFAEQQRERRNDIPEAFRTTDRPLPRFASLGADKVNMRAGPARDYPVQWVYNRQNLPVEIVLEYDGWRKIRDPDGATGWVHNALLSGKRYVRIDHNRDVIVRTQPDEDSQPAIRLEPNVIARLNQCKQHYCKLSVGGYQGWVERKILWGVYVDEKLD